MGENGLFLASRVSKWLHFIFDWLKHMIAMSKNTIVALVLL